VLGALLLGNAGVSWDNAKQYIVTGAHGGRFTVDEAGNRSENPVHAAASISDGVGDPLKDATVPALQVVAKLLCITILVFLPFFL
jgi:K(+)-stimulated pyrophosphate-energized sodium pump